MSIKITSTDPEEHIASIMKEEEATEDSVDSKDKSAASDKKSDESSSDSATEGAEDKKDKDKKGEDEDPDSDAAKGAKADKRIGKITKEKSDAERERDYWKSVALEGKKLPTDKAVDKKPEKVAEKEPNPDDFEKPTDYYKAVAKFEAVKVKEDVKAELLAEQAAEKANERQTTILTQWDAKMAEARTRYKDYDEVTGKDVPLDKDGIVQETFLTSEVGADIAYWWGNNEDEVKEILKLTPVARARELGKLEARIQAEVDAAKKKDDKSSSTGSAQSKPKPKPLAPLGGQSGGNVEPDEDKLPYREWADKKNQQLKRRR